MELKDLKVGMNIRYENQKWKGTVTGIRTSYSEAIVVFEGDRTDELMEVSFLKPF